MVSNPFDSDVYPLSEPDSIVVGSFVAWRREIDFDDTLYAVRYELVPRTTGTTLTVTGSQNGNYWEFNIPSATSEGWTDPEGEYRMNMIVQRISDSEDAEVETTHVTIFGSTQDRRTHAEIMLEKINSILAGRADHDVESYSIKSRSITRMSVGELTKWRDYYVDEIARTGGSEAQQGAAKSNTVKVRFV